ncbi:ABC transporter permease [Arenibaculum pallidiluteum]|uniref:ABC transporter permease n=1 Tax=Arenibaculum pallidiluteum TaxID=2812559 RepID=UPI002E2840C2|nr:ABC transporter permease [Arenibaculum pallidiluteum]
MSRILGYRLFQALLVAVTVGLLTFVMVRSLPGDMAYRIAAGRYGYDMVSSDAANAVRAELGLGGGGAAALALWFLDLFRLDFGESVISGRPVLEEIRHQLGHTVGLSVAAILLSVLLGPPLGIAAGLRPGGALDRGLLVAASMLRALPHFVVGLILIMLVSAGLGILPAAGHGGTENLVLPALTLALGLGAVSARVARDAMVQVAASPYYAFGRVKGLSEARVFLRHGLRNVSVPVVTYLGVQFVGLIEGVVVVESLFAWPGIGHALVHAIFSRDVPVIQGTALVMGMMFVLLNAAVDLACLWLDPRKQAS